MSNPTIEIIRGSELRAGDKFLDDHGQVWKAKTCTGSNHSLGYRYFAFVNEETNEIADEKIEDRCWLDRVKEN